MIKHKRIGIAACLFMAAAVLLTGFAYFKPEALASVTEISEQKYVSEMDKAEILSIQIIADEAEWEDMLENATAEEYIPATLIINGTKIENVGIRPKGNSSLSTVAADDTTDRFSFKLEFDHYIKGQTWLGLDKLVINNMHSDASYMKEYLSYDIMDYAGVSAPLYAFADITVNGSTWGFYLAVEALEDSYIERIYGSDHGELYKPESTGMQGEGGMSEFTEGMREEGGMGEFPAGMWENAEQQTGNAQVPQMGEQQSQSGEPPQTGNFPDMQPGQSGEAGGDAADAFQGRQGGFGGGMGGMASNSVSLQYTDNEISSYSAIFDNSVFKTGDEDYERVIESLEKLSNGEDLENVVDVEAVLKYFAAHTVVVNLDSYVSSMGHNYYLYEENGQLTILPWDYNLAFGGFQSGSASDVINFPIDTPVSGVSLEDRPLLGKLLEVPEYLELYHGYLRQIVDGYFDSGLFESTIDSLDAMIASYVENDPTAFYDYDAYKAAVSELKALGLLRAESICGQLDGTIPSTSEGQSAEPDKLVDASGIDLSVLGSQGGGRGGGMGGLAAEQEAFGMQRPDRTQSGEGAAGPSEQQQSTGPSRQANFIATGYDANTWIVLGLSLLLLLGGLSFVFLFRRRRGT